MAAALAPVDIASWAGDADLHLNNQMHFVIVMAIYLMILPSFGSRIVTFAIREQAERSTAAHTRAIERAVDDQLTARQDQIVSTFTELIRELVDELRPKHQHMINQTVRDVIRPEINAIKRDVAKGLSAATRAGLIAGAQQQAAPRRRRGRDDEASSPMGTVTRFPRVSNEP
jgi:hypothetical protein